MARPLRLLALQRFRGHYRDGLYGAPVHGNRGPKTDLGQHLTDAFVVARIARRIPREQRRLPCAVDFELRDHFVRPDLGRNWQGQDREGNHSRGVNGSVTSAGSGASRGSPARSDSGSFTARDRSPPSRRFRFRVLRRPAHCSNPPVQRSRNPSQRPLAGQEWEAESAAAAAV
jgi:hypothetical protein